MTTPDIIQTAPEIEPAHEPCVVTDLRPLAEFPLAVLRVVAAIQRNAKPVRAIPADCLGLQVVQPSAASLAAKQQFFARKKAERIQRQAEDAALLKEA